MAVATGWSVRVRGDEFVLERLATVFASGRHTVHRDNSECIMKMVGFGSTADTLDVLNEAERVVRRTAAILNVFASVHGDVWAENAIYTFPDGRSRGLLASLRLTVSVSSRKRLADLAAPDGCGTTGSAILESASKDAALMAILTEIGGGELGWERLYKIYEYVKDTCGGKQRLAQVTDTSLREISRFTETANRPRHAPNSRRRPPSPSPMTIDYAREFVRRLLFKILSDRPSRSAAT